MAVCSFPGLVPVFWFRHQKGYTAFTLLHTFRGYLSRSGWLYRAGARVVGRGRWLRRIWVTDGSSLELEALQKIAADLLKLTSKDLDAHVELGELQEICHDDQA